MADAAPIFVDSGLRGKRVLVTGGSRGIGRAIVELFAAEGASVTFFFRENASAADEVVGAARRAGRHVEAARVDVRDAAACAQAVERVIEAGGVDVLVNNAAIVRDALLASVEDDDLEAVLATNVRGVVHVTRAVLPHMISRRAGKIVSMSSVAAARGGKGQTTYAASKGAVESMTRALAVEVASRNITVNAVAPGIIETDMSRRIREHAGDRATATILMRRFGTPAEIAAAVLFLASRHGDYITGHVLRVDGGFRME